MKALTTEQVLENLKAEFGNLSYGCQVEVFEGRLSSDTAYRMTTHVGQCVVTRKAVWEWTNQILFDIDTRDEKGNLILGGHGTFTFDGTRYKKCPNKVQAEKLLRACGFKKLAVIESTKPKTIKEQLEALPYYLRSQINITDAARFIKEITAYTETLYQVFQQVRVEVVTYTDASQSLLWKYYTGRGKTFRDGKGKIMLDPVFTQVLVPELERVAIKYGKTVINPPKLENMEAA